MFNLSEFLEKVLCVPQSNIRESDIDAVNRLATPRHTSVICGGGSRVGFFAMFRPGT